MHILSAGAAQGLVEGLRLRFQQEHAVTVSAEYGAAGAIMARVLAAEPVDLVILPAPLIEQLIAQGTVISGSRRDLGQVGTALAVRRGMQCPRVDSPGSLRRSLLAATRIICPDPAVATAGQVFMAALAALDIAEQVRDRLEYTQSGSAAITRMAQAHTPAEIGVMQLTEIRASSDVVLAGLMPASLQRFVTYSLAQTSAAGNVDYVQKFVEYLTGRDGRARLRSAGFDVGPVDGEGDVAAAVMGSSVRPTTE